MKTLVTMMILTVLTFSINARAKSGGHDGNGGDSISQEFTSLGREVLITLKMDSNKFPEVSAENFEETIKKTEIVTTEKQILIMGIEKDAANYPEQYLIKVNRSRWSQIKNIKRKKALIFHEYLGIMNFDDSKYQISGRMLSNKIEHVADTELTILLDGNYRQLIDDGNSCDYHIEVNSKVSSIFVTPITNQRTREYCYSVDTYTLNCKNDLCTGDGYYSVQIIDSKAYVINGIKMVYYGNQDIKPAKNFTFGSWYGFQETKGHSFGSENRCAIFAKEGYYWCDDLEIVRTSFCPQAQMRAEDQALNLCENKSGKVCQITKSGTQKPISNQSQGSYNSNLQVYEYYSDLYCAVTGVVASPIR